MKVEKVGYGNMDAGSAAVNMIEGYPVRREGWDFGIINPLFIFKQIPCEIGLDIIPNMQSVPVLVKEIILNAETTLKYNNQIAAVYIDGRIDSWNPTVEDFLAKDYHIIK
jgi:hypothetical protein